MKDEFADNSLEQQGAQAGVPLNDKYMALLDIIDDKFCTVKIVTDGSGKPSDFIFINANAAFKDGVGCADIIGKTLSEVIPQSKTEWLNAAAGVTITGQPAYFTDMLSNSGYASQAYMYPFGQTGEQVVAVLLKKAANQADRSEVYDTNLIEKQQAADALKASEEKYYTLFHSIDEGYCIIQMIYDQNGKAVDWRFLEVNRAFEVNNGLHNAQGKTIKQTTPDIEDKWLDIYDKVAQTGEAIRFMEDSAALKRHFSLYAFRIGDPDDRKVAVIFTDITKQISAEAALKQSEEQFRTLTQSLPQLIWTTDANGYCDFFNQQWLDYTGAEFDEVKGDGWVQYMNPEHRPEVHRKWQKSLLSGAPIINEFQLKGKDGQYNWFYAAGNPVKNANGEIIKWVGTLTNIEGQKRAEWRLQQLVEERTKELQRTNANLQQFAHMASHDLSEPVRKIHMLANRIADEDGNILSENGKFYLERINSAVDRMNAMIEGVLEFSVLTNLKERAVPVCLDQIMKKVEEDLELTIQQKHVKLYYDSLPTVNGVETLLYQLFYNLVRNAVKFAVAGRSPVITIRYEPVTDNGEPFSKITVTDNGIGFSDDDSEKIFDSFTRLHSKDKYEGTGLGLALCKNIVNRHGGSITASGKKGEGAVFTVLLPAVKEGF